MYRFADDRGEVAPGVYVQNLRPLTDYAAETLYPEINRKRTISVDITGLESKVSAFAEEVKDRTLNYIMNPEHYDEVDYTTVGQQNPLPTIVVEKGYKQWQVVPDELKDKTDPSWKNESYGPPGAVEVIHPDVENGFIDFIHRTQFLLDAYHYFGKFGFSTYAEDAEKLFYDPEKAFSEMDVDRLTRDIDNFLHKTVSRGAQEAKEKIAQDALQEAGRTVAEIWDIGAAAIEDADDPELRELYRRAREVEEYWDNATDEEGIRELKEYIENEVWDYLVNDVGEHPEYEEGIGIIAEGADYAEYELDDALEELQNL